MLKGFTIIEVLISTVLTLSLFATMLNFYSQFSHRAQTQLKLLELQIEIENVTKIIEKDLKRNQFGLDFNTIFFWNKDLLDKKCLITFFDLNENLSLDTNESVAYKFTNGDLKYASNFTEPSQNCESGYWRQLSDPSWITFENVRFALLKNNLFLIEISAFLTESKHVKSNLTKHIYLPNVP